MNNILKNHNEFIELIEKIDAQFKKNDVPIHGRPIEAVRECAKKLKIEIKLGPNCKAIPGKYNWETLTGHINDWYEKRYGERLKENFSPGSAAFLIKGDVWKINTPLILGKVRFTVDRDLDKYAEAKKVGFAPNLPIYNVLKSIEGFTPEVASTLSNYELFDILAFIKWLSDILHILIYLRTKQLSFIYEAKADYDSAVFYIFMRQYGLSKWGSLQFVEKLLKCFLSFKGVRVPKTHELIKLSGLAKENGLPNILKSAIEKVQCAAGVRYGEDVVPLEEAVAAHHASLIICNVIVLELKKLIFEKSKNKESK